MIIYYMGFEAQTSYRLPSPPCGSSTASNSAMGGTSASSFPARTVANPSMVASVSFMMADAVFGLASFGTMYPDDTFWRSMM